MMYGIHVTASRSGRGYVRRSSQLRVLRLLGEVKTTDNPQCAKLFCTKAVAQRWVDALTHHGISSTIEEFNGNFTVEFV